MTAYLKLLGDDLLGLTSKYAGRYMWVYLYEKCKLDRTKTTMLYHRFTYSIEETDGKREFRIAYDSITHSKFRPALTSVHMGEPKKYQTTNDSSKLVWYVKGLREHPISLYTGVPDIISEFSTMGCFMFHKAGEMFHMVDYSELKPIVRRRRGK